MDDKKLENKIEDEQLEEVSGGRRGTRAIGPKDTLLNEAEEAEKFKRRRR